MQKHITFLGITVGMLSAAPVLYGADLLKDPETGQHYRRVASTVEVPVVETQVQQQHRTVYTPEVVTEVHRQARTIYRPEVEMVYEQRLHGWWNPFTQPTVAYHLVPKTKWVAHTEEYAIPHTTTRWKPRTETVDVERRVTRLEKQTRYELQAIHSPSPIVTPEAATSPRPAASVASSSLDSTRRENRSTLQSGMQAQELVPVGSVPAYSNRVWR